MLTIDKAYSFRRTKFDETNQILRTECKNLPQTYFMDQGDNWVKSNIALNENICCKNFVCLLETGDEKFSKTICFFLKQCFYRIKTSAIIIIVATSKFQVSFDGFNLDSMIQLCMGIQKWVCLLSFDKKFPRYSILHTPQNGFLLERISYVLYGLF